MSDSFANRLILVVDDEEKMVKFIQTNLEMDGFRVISAPNGAEAVEKVRTELPDLVLLDVMMPEMDGFEALERIRQISDVPVIMLTVKGELEDKHAAFSRGADDYLTKPFSPRELTDRIRAILRRTSDKTLPSDAFVKVDDRLQIDFAHHEVIVEGKRIKLRPTEWRLLYHLVQNAGWVMPYETLLQKVWGYEYREESQLLRMYIAYLRQKIEEDSSNPRYILTERGFGYRFVDFRRKEGQGKEPDEAGE
ncbi:MAG: response regulator transcription factor [Anaerolineae bacterium]|nr:response regulator transcription factor [Anaerolineae bacterium]